MDIIEQINDTVTSITNASGHKPDQMRLGKMAYNVLCQQLTELRGVKVSRLRTYLGMNVAISPILESHTVVIFKENP